jgi:DNA polymerase-3 subunit chi
MTKVNFYPLDSELAAVRLQFACRLSEKVQAMGHRVFIHAESPEQAKLLDDLLWQFRATSFLPHELVADVLIPENNTAKAAGAPGSVIKERIVIGDQVPACQDDVLINLTGSPCSSHQQFSFINEILSSDPESLVRGRDCFRFYRTQGYQTETHKL